jgi:hypothetical protein
MGDIRGDNKPEDYVHFIKHTQQNKEFIVKWINEINKRNTGPGRGSHPAFIKLYSSLNFTKLPPGYVSMGISNVDSKQTYFNNGNIKTHKLI